MFQIDMEWLFKELQNLMNQVQEQIRDPRFWRGVEFAARILEEVAGGIATYLELQQKH